MIECNTCGSTDMYKTTWLNKEGIKLPIDRCNRCGHSNVPSFEKNRRKPLIKKYTTPTIVYFILSANGLVKIGRSINIKSRFKSLCSMSPVKLELLHTIEGTHYTEVELHKKFDPIRSHGEWFYYTDDLKKHIQKSILDTEKGARTNDN